MNISYQYYDNFKYADKHDILESQTWLGMITAKTISYELNTLDTPS